MSEVRKLILVDAHSLIHQAFHALPPLTTRDGEPTNAVHGFANMLLRLLEDEQPDALALAFDTPEPTFRHQAFPDYKAHRPPMDELLVRQLPVIDELVAAFRWPALRAPGFEADDILATLACRASAEPGWQVFIVTADRDLCQLASDTITILATKGRGISDVHRFDPAAVTERFGVPPERIPDWKALVGDTSDNIPGVTGIGEKTATALLQQHGDLESLLAAADSITGKRGENLRASMAQARESLKLATVCREVPLDCVLDELRRQEFEAEAVQRLLTRLEFHNLLRRLSPRTVTPRKPLTYQPVLDDATAARVAEEVAGAQVVGLAWSADRAGLAVSCDLARAWYLPLAAGERQMELFAEQKDLAAERARLETVLAPLAAGAVGFVCHDVQALYRGLGIGHSAWGALRGDTHLASWLLDPERQDHPLHTCGHRLLGAPPPLEVPEDERDPGGWLACREADLARRLEPRLREELEADRLLTLYLELELPLAPVLGRMMDAGIVIDRAATGRLDEELAARLEGVRATILETAGRECNLDSPKQLGELLFVELGLPAGRKTKTGFSTDAATLQPLVELHPVVSLILDYRELAKLKSTYTEPLLALSEPETGRIRTRLNQTGAATGRLSSSQPNLQNIPVRGDWGERVRDLFSVPPGWRMLAADYSQIELRVLAHVSGDRRMIEAFRRGEDIHSAAALEIFGTDEVSADQRRMAKVLNFGIAYGIGPHGLSQRIEVSRDEAKALIEAYFARFPGVKQYADDTIRRAREQGFVQTIFGRRRRLGNIRNKNPNLRQAAERAAINMPIQGAASDIIKRAMLRLEAVLAERGGRSRQILQVHDELLLEVPPDELAETAAAVREAMVSAAELDVPLEVKIEVGESWARLAAWSNGRSTGAAADG